MAFHKKSVKSIAMTEALATGHLDRPTVPGDRPVNKFHVRDIEEELMAGTFTSCVWAICYVAEECKTYRANGRHSALAFFNILNDDQRKSKFPRKYEVTLEEWHADNMSDLRTIYNGYDSALSTRSQTDVIRSHVAFDEDLFGINERLLVTIPGAFEFHSSGNYGRCRTRNRRTGHRASLIAENKDFVKFVVELREMGSEPFGTKLMRVPVFAAMIATRKADEHASKEFWTLVLTEEHPEVENPTRKLATYLRNIRIVNKGRAVKGSHPREVYGKCVTAWNAWRKNQPTALYYFHSKPLPEPV